MRQLLHAVVPQRHRHAYLTSWQQEIKRWPTPPEVSRAHSIQSPRLQVKKRLFLFLNIFLSNNLSATVYFSQRMMYNYHNLKNILLENETPFIELEGDGHILVEVNKSVELKFNASDDEAFSYQVLQQPSTGFSFNDSNGVAIWTPPDSSVVNIRYSQINVFCGDPIQCS